MALQDKAHRRGQSLASHQRGERLCIDSEKENSDIFFGHMETWCDITILTSLYAVKKIIDEECEWSEYEINDAALEKRIEWIHV